MHKVAKEVIENQSCLVLNEVLAEVVYVLSGHYETPRADVSSALEVLMREENLTMHMSKSIIFEAFRLYASSSLDYVDCYLCAMKKKYTIATFDKKLNKCINQ